MPKVALGRLSALLHRSTCYLEYGAGASTALALSLGVERVYSVESDPAWAHVSSRDAPPGVLTMLAMDIGPVSSFGSPRSVQQSTAFGDYSLAVWERLEQDGQSPDVVLVDGRFRVACFMASLLHARPGTPILFDDYARRSAYHAVERFAVPQAQLSRMAEFVVPEKIDVSAAWRLLARHAGDPR